MAVCTTSTFIQDCGNKSSGILTATTSPRAQIFPFADTVAATTTFFPLISFVTMVKMIGVIILKCFLIHVRRFLQKLFTTT
jgi:hypothetical protein